MNINSTYQPEFESLKALLIEMAMERSVDVLLNLIVNRMVQRPHIALVRIWLKKKADICNKCSMFKLCGQKKECLHLVASKGDSISMPPHNFSDLNGHGQRIPMGVTCIGKVAQNKKPLSPEDIKSDPDWQNRDNWAKGEHLLGFGGQPLRFKDDVFGVIAIYSRIKSDRVKEGRFWLNMIANHTAAAIANANAFRQIDHLKSQLELENQYLKEEINQARSFGSIIGKSPSLMNILNQIELVAPTDASVFIFGESGTGKELAAREIHNRSLRKDKPMIKVNCASIPGELYESEFFGHIKGAFTGAVKNRAGRFQAADGGTLFLDEIGELPLALQGKLLRVLQEGAYERIGEDITRHVNVRIIAATNKNIKQEIKQGRFRQDLYYRLNVFPIEIEPLRNRKEDIRLLTYHFLEKISSDMNRDIPDISSAGMKQLISYHWPGNVRELRNIIERSIITSGDMNLKLTFPDNEQQPLSYNPAGNYLKNKAPTDKVLTDKELNRFVKKNIQAALKACNGKIYGKDGAANLLGCVPTTLCSRIKKFNINILEIKK
ncbi:transcriptional activator [Desulfobacula toluolica Tol2]|uniref:Transcriptional activator n=2 Tax=Desulfobacula toluolica TaxID=28223 RepID=K0NF39_DESTT|nr:transcriptional activator [Desulfobacula toluolica Tol2]